MRRILPLMLGALVWTSCTPFISHGAAVAPGYTGGLTAGFQLSQCDTLCGPMIMQPFGVWARYGLGSSTDSLAGRLSIGGYVPAALLIPATGVDVYYQARRRSTRYAFGAGANVSAFDVMPYVEVGTRVSSYAEWYAVAGNAIGSHRPYSTSDESFKTLLSNHGLRYWNVSAGGQLHREHVWATFFASVLRGEETLSQSDGLSRRPLRLLLLGVSGGLQGGQAVGVPPVRRPPVRLPRP